MSYYTGNSLTFPTYTQPRNHHNQDVQSREQQQQQQQQSQQQQQAMPVLQPQHLNNTVGGSSPGSTNIQPHQIQQQAIAQADHPRNQSPIQNAQGTKAQEEAIAAGIFEEKRKKERKNRPGQKFGAKKKSWVWTWFVQDAQDSNIAACDYCGKIITRLSSDKGSPKKLSEHLKTHKLTKTSINNTRTIPVDGNGNAYAAANMSLPYENTSYSSAAGSAVPSSTAPSSATSVAEVVVPKRKYKSRVKSSTSQQSQQLSQSQDTQEQQIQQSSQSPQIQLQQQLQAQQHQQNQQIQQHQQHQLSQHQIHHQHHQHHQHHHPQALHHQQQETPENTRITPQQHHVNHSHIHLSNQQARSNSPANISQNSSNVDYNLNRRFISPEFDNSPYSSSKFHRHLMKFLTDNKLSINVIKSHAFKQLIYDLRSDSVADLLELTGIYSSLIEVSRFEGTALESELNKSSAVGHSGLSATNSEVNVVNALAQAVEKAIPSANPNP